MPRGCFHRYNGHMVKYFSISGIKLSVHRFPYVVHSDMSEFQWGFTIVIQFPKPEEMVQFSSALAN